MERKMLELVKELESECRQPCEVRVIRATPKGYHEEAFAKLSKRKIKVVELGGWKNGLKGGAEGARWYENWDEYVGLITPIIERDMREMIGEYSSQEEFEEKLKQLNKRMDKEGPWAAPWAHKILEDKEKRSRALTYLVSNNMAMLCVGTPGCMTPLEEPPLARIEYEPRNARKP